LGKRTKRRWKSEYGYLNDMMMKGELDTFDQLTKEECGFGF
jgi:hypothetical protein